MILVHKLHSNPPTKDKPCFRGRAELCESQEAGETEAEDVKK